MGFGSMADVAMEREGEVAGGRVTAAHLVCLCGGGGWKALVFARVETHMGIPLLRMTTTTENEKGMSAKWLAEWLAEWRNGGMAEWNNRMAGWWDVASF